MKSKILVQVIDANNSPICEDDHQKIVMILAATNFSWDIDEALRLFHCLLVNIFEIFLLYGSLRFILNGNLSKM